MSVVTATLSEVADINPRVDRGEFSDLAEVVTFVPMAQVSEVSGAITSEDHRPVGELLKGFTPFVDRDVLVAKITPCFENGKIAHARISKRAGFGSTEFHVIRANTERLDDRYLFHFLRQPLIRVRGEKRMTGSGGQRRVPKAFLQSLDIPLPPLAEQRRIAAILDKADALRAKRREAIAKLDQLLQSVFLDMFGDPLANPKAEVRELSQLCTRITDGTHQSPEWADSGVPFLFQSNVKPYQIDLATKKWISPEEYELLTARCPIEFGDVLFTIVGSYGNAAMVRTHEKFCFQRHIAHLKPCDDVLPEFLEAMLNQRAVKRQADERVTGIAQKTLILKELRRLKVLMPSPNEQQAFAETSESIRQQKQKLQHNAGQLDTLFASLQHRAFTGTL